MSTLLSTLLSLVLSPLIGQLTENINKVTMDTMPQDSTSAALAYESIYGYYNTIIQQTYYMQAVPSAEIVDRLCSTQLDNGSWPDIDYWDTKRSNWSPMSHAVRVQTMAIVWRKAQQEGIPADRYLDVTLKAMRYWFSEMPVCRNWWYNEIGIPKMMGPAFLLVKEKMTRADMDGAIKVMEKSRLYKTGSNIVWLAGNVVVCGILKGDTELIKQARQAMSKEITITEKEGIQADFSFHQHGAQPQFGNYGMAYASILSYWARIFSGTPLEFEPQKMELLRQFIVNGLNWPSWKGCYDQNANGRQVFKGTQKKNYHAFLYVLRNISAFAGKQVDQIGAKYFWRSDFGVVKTPRWYASIRMQSADVEGFEMTNGENMSGYFCSDGALLILKDGDEYYDISPQWNWRHIPGTTAYDDGHKLHGRKDAKFPYNKSKLVSGVSDSDGNMVAAMQLERDSLCADKAYFFWKNGIVCLGAGITMNSDCRVTTGVEQCVAKTRIESHNRWYRHNGITYIRMDKNRFKMEPLLHSGTWGDIAHFYDKTIEERDLFEIYIDHGTNVKDASYAYAISPASDYNGRVTAKRMNRDVRIISNSTENQVVYIKSTDTFFYVSWNGCPITVKKKGLLGKKIRIPVSEPCSGILNCKTGRLMYAKPFSNSQETEFK